MNSLLKFSENSESASRESAVLLKTLHRFLFVYICLHSLLIPLAHNVSAQNNWFSGLEGLFLIHVFLLYFINKPSGKKWILATISIVMIEMLTIGQQVLMNARSWKTLSGLLVAGTSLIFIPLALTAYNRSNIAHSSRKKGAYESLLVVIVTIFSLTPSCYYLYSNLSEFEMRMQGLSGERRSTKLDDSRKTFSLADIFQVQKDSSVVRYDISEGFKENFLLGPRLSIISNRPIPYLKIYLVRPDLKLISEKMISPNSREKNEDQIDLKYDEILNLFSEELSHQAPLFLIKFPHGRKQKQTLWIPLSVTSQKEQLQKVISSFHFGNIEFTENGLIAIDKKNKGNENGK